MSQTYSVYPGGRGGGRVAHPCHTASKLRTYSSVSLSGHVPRAGWLNGDTALVKNLSDFDEIPQLENNIEKSRVFSRIRSTQLATSKAQESQGTINQNPTATPNLPRCVILNVLRVRTFWKHPKTECCRYLPERLLFFILEGELAF